MLLVYHTSLSVGYLISASTRDPQTANTIGLPIGVVLFLFAGQRGEGARETDERKGEMTRYETSDR